MSPIYSLFFSQPQESPPSISEDLAHIQHAARSALSTIGSLFSSLGGWAIPRTFLPLVETTLSYAASIGYVVTVCIALVGYTNLSIIVCLLSTTTLIGVGVTTLAKSQQSLSENIDAFEEQNGQLKEHVGHLSQEVNTLSSTNIELKQTKDDLNQTNRDLQETNKDLQDTHRALSSEVSAFSQQNHRLAHQVTTLDRIRRGFAEQVVTMRQEVTTLGQHNQTLRQETTTLRENNRALQGSLQILEERLSAFGELNGIFSQLARDTQQVLNQEGRQIEDLLRLFSEQIADFKEQCEALQVDASSHATFLSEFKRLIDTSVLSKRLTELAAITQQIREATNALTTVQESVTQAARTLGEFDGQIVERDAILRKTQEELGALFEQLRAERSRLSEVRVELEALIARAKVYKERPNG